ncbi:MAG: hypothetical protein D6B28_06770 [Gammaproteobacteria bacterium]|nr:MAG: hypothetical protein D6B28_06770 [Gammaproteobacteria bacterium]
MCTSKIIKGVFAAGLMISASAFSAQSTESAFENPIVQERVSLVGSVSISTPQKQKKFSAMHRSGSGAPVEYMTVKAMGREFDLVLEVNELFNQNLQVDWRGAQAQVDSDHVYYKGTVKGIEGSWVRLTVNDGEITGTIRTPEEIYTIEPKRNLIKQQSTSAKKEMVMYRMSEVGTGLPANFCGVEAEGEEHFEIEAAQESVKEFNKMVAEMRAMEEVTVMASTGIKELKVGVAADYEYYQKHGAGSAAKIQSLFNQIDGIYREELGIALNLTRITVFSDSADPFSDTTDSFSLLKEAGNYFAASASFTNNGMNQFMSGKNLDGNTIGLAYVNTVCYSTKKYRVSLVQSYESFASAQLIVSAHEMGHNLGASHDTAADGMHIMWPSASSSIELTFSERSKGEITPNLSKSCFTATADIKIDLAVEAGDGIAEFTATVTNKTQEQVDGVALAVDLPSDLSLTADSIAAYNCTEALGQISCDLGDLAGAAVEEITFMATYTTIEQMRVDATVGSDMADYYDQDNADYVLINQQEVTPASAGGSSGGGASGESGGGGSTGLIMLALLGIAIVYRYSIQPSGQKVTVNNKDNKQKRKQ